MDLIFITNDTQVAAYAQESGVDRIMCDLEILGKEDRQGHLNTVISKHTLNDVKSIRNVIDSAELLVRVNPINKKSKYEIEEVISIGADIIMLPMFTTSDEVEEFISFVNKRAKICLLLETPQAMVRIDDILEIEGIDEIHIGLNDLHLAMNLNFMFELLSGGIVEYLSSKIISKNIKFGFGGIARVGQGTLDSTSILMEHYRLNSTQVILSRDFKNYVEDYESIKSSIDLKAEVDKIRNFMNRLNDLSKEDFEQNSDYLKDKVNEIANLIKNRA